MSNRCTSSKVRRILGPGNLYSPGCREWLWLKEDGSTVRLGFTLGDACTTLRQLEHQTSSDEEILERLLALNLERAEEQKRVKD